MEAAIAEGPEALQKFINSGEIEELHDVLPHDDEHDYLNDAYLDEDEERNEKTDEDVRHHDQDMRKLGHQFRNSGDVDLRNNPRHHHHHQDVDFRNNMTDYDMRHMNNTQMSDEDYRMPYNRDQDFRMYNDDEEMSEENYDDDFSGGGGGGNNYQQERNFYNNNNNNQFNQNNNRFQPPPLLPPQQQRNNFNSNNGYQNFRNQQSAPRMDFRPPPLDEHWNGGGGDGFRGGRGGWGGRGGPPRGGMMRGGVRGGRGGGPPPRGGGGRGPPMRGRF